MPKILFISQYFLPDLTAVSFRLYETATLLQKKGFDIQILTSRPHRDTLKNFDYKKINIPVIRVPALGLKKNNKISYILHYISFFKMAMLYGIFRTNRSFDYVIATIPSPLTGLAGFILSKFKKAKFVLDVRDVWPDSIVAVGKIKRTSIIYKLCKKLELFIYKKANLITCVSQNMANYILSQAKGKKISVIYNSFDTRIEKKIQTENISQYFPKNLPIITYVGNIGNAQNIGLLIEAAKHFQKRINFLLIGAGILKKDLEENVKNLGLENVSFRGPFLREKAIAIEMASWALFLNLKSSDAFSKTIPSKIFEYLYAKKPIIYGLEGETKKILSQTGANLYFQPDNLTSLVEALEKLYKNYPELSQKTSSNKGLVLENYTRQKMTEKLIFVLKKL